jgi:hypothetical protein
MNLCCRVCGAPSGDATFPGKLLGQLVDYFDCSVCGYVQTQAPTWLEQAYTSAINSCDTGIMLRNQTNVGVVLATMATLGDRFGRVVDCAGGYGILVRLLRDQGVEALWADRYCENLLAEGFEHSAENADLVTAFEAFEHFVKPQEELEQLFAIAPNVLLSTEIIASPAPKQTDWWYYGPDHGQHIGFFRVKTLSYLANRFGKHLVTDGHSYHLLAQKPVAAVRWRLNRRLVRYWPRLFTRGMSSKVWSDFEQMSNS